MAQFGQIFETLVLTRLQTIYRTYTQITYPTTAEDKFRGTDIFFYGYPVDITINKNKTFISKKFGYKGQCSIYFRYSNGHMMFDRPVVVVEFNVQNVKEVNAAAFRACNTLIDLLKDFNRVLPLLQKKTAMPIEIEDLKVKLENSNDRHVVAIGPNGEKIYGF